MRTIKITSPCYRSNGLNGRYVSIGFCDHEGRLTKIVGDHVSLTGKTHADIKGMPFSDSDRFITISSEIDIDINALEAWEDAYHSYLVCREHIEEERLKRFGEDTYAYLFKCNRAEREARMQEYLQFCEDTKITPVDYYGFLIAVKK